MLVTLLLAAGLTMPSAPVCDRAELPACVASLPPSLRRSFPSLWGQSAEQQAAHLSRQLDGQGAVTLLLEQQALIVTDRRRIAQPHIVLLDGRVIEWPSVHSPSLALAHEQGHLLPRSLGQAFRAPHWPSPWADEVVADLHLLWQSARRGELDMAWRLYHLRNINLIQSAPDWSHWSVPVLYPWLSQPRRLQRAAEASFESMLLESRFTLSDLNHYRMLGQRQFGGSPHSSGFPYVPPPLVQRWWRMLEPTLSLLLAADYPSYRQRVESMMVKSANSR
ncbi:MULTISPECIES: hypothetical protein [Ferrimonas]|uniref:hypothetical protein n=1 Tax=Ferrimonas TaxID=44011 RepID=UPI000406C8A1|nr:MULTISPECIES: hypothetical protein [Ferrimonas]USD37016.1 hypothetical protein J8Z22_18785 [Ferrimonas sp. SCSIO 43195]